MASYKLVMHMPVCIMGHNGQQRSIMYHGHHGAATQSGDQVIRERPGKPGHRRIGRCSCRVVGTPVHSSGTRLTLTLDGGLKRPPRPVNLRTDGTQRVLAEQFCACEPADHVADASRRAAPQLAFL